MVVFGSDETMLVMISTGSDSMVGVGLWRAPLGSSRDDVSLTKM